MRRYLYCLTWLVVFLPAAAPGQVIYDQAATAGESYARGASDIIRSQGEANLNNSQAAINAQDAYSKAIDNSLKSVDAFWQRRDIYKQRQAEELYQITAHRQRYLDRHGLKSLTTEEFDRTTGSINWPGPLRQDQYAQYRETFEALFKKRAQEGWLGSEDYMQSKELSKEWRDILAGQRDQYPSDVLKEMVRFVLKLDRELNENLS